MTLSMRLLPHVSVGLLALVLAGCGGGGDDGNPLDEARAERDAALAAQMAAETAQMAAETAQMEAEAAQAAAEAAQMVAEMAREEAVNERDIAQAAEMTAMAAQAAAETARDAAMAAQMTADTARQMAEDARVAAEAERDNAQLQREAAMTAQMAAEAERDAAMAAQQMADTARIAAEADRDAAVASAASAMAAQTAAEAARDAAVAAQAAAVAARDEARAAQVTAETAEALAEAARMEAEAERDIKQAALTLATAAQAAAEAARDAAQADRDATQAQLIATEAARDSARAERDLAQTQLAALQTDRDRLRDDLTQAQADNRIQMARIQTLEDDIADLDDQIVALTADVDDRDDQIAMLRSERDGLRDDLVDARATIRIREARIQDLDDDIVALNAEIVGLRADVADKDGKIAMLTADLMELTDRQSEGNLMASQGGHLIHVFPPTDAPDDVDDAADSAGFGERAFPVPDPADMGSGYTRVSYGHRGPAGLRVVVDNDTVAERSEVADADDADPTPAPAYARSGAPVSAGSGWHGSTYTRNIAGGAMLQRVVYTNVEAPTQEDFATAYGGLEAETPPTDADDFNAYYYKDFRHQVRSNGDIWFFDEDGEFVALREEEPAGTFMYYSDTTKDTVVQISAVTTGEMAAQRIHRIINSVDFNGNPKAGKPDLHATNRDVNPGDYVATPEMSASHFWTLVRFNRSRIDAYDSGDGFVGYLDGVRGQFRCTATDGCNINAGPKSDATEDPVDMTSGEMWAFVADSATANVATRRADADYLTIGWWIEEPGFAAGRYRFNRDYTGSDVYRETIATVTGSATYKGPAVGIWAERVRELEQADSGNFRADATLTADFGEDNDIGGTITNFVLDNGQSRQWSVTLGRTMNPVPDTPAMAATSGLADGRSWTGMWGGQYYGNGGTRRATDDPLPQPSHIAGDFRASFGTPEIGPEDQTGQGTEAREADVGFVGVSGVFGAEWQEPPEDN